MRASPTVFARWRCRARGSAGDGGRDIPIVAILVVVVLERLRGRVPFLAFVLLAVLCLALIGFACACLDDQFAQALDRVVQSAPAAVIEVWPAFAASMLASLTLIVLSVPASGRASPALLQRFLF